LEEGKNIYFVFLTHGYRAVKIQGRKCVNHLAGSYFLVTRKKRPPESPRTRSPSIWLFGKKNVEEVKTI
jgi:hypothetical protein